MDSSSSSADDFRVYDIKLPLRYRGRYEVYQHTADFSYVEEPRGNMFTSTSRFDVPALNLIALRTAELICLVHSEGRAHGHLGPSAFYLDGNSIVLLDVGLYGLAQKDQERIRLTPSHHYKARAELGMDPVVSNENMDIHSWAKSMIALYSRRELRASFGTVIPTITQPPEMPDDVWRVVSQCLDERLSIPVNMENIVEQLAAFDMR